MNYKPTPEIEASFRRVERILDAMLEESHIYLERERIAVRDDTNRSGFGGGFPYFAWRYQFEKWTPYGSEIKLAAARLNYLEPILEEEAQMINVTSIAEIFQTGKESRVKELKERVYPVEKFLNMKMDQVIVDCITVAEQVLAKY